MAAACGVRAWLAGGIAGPLLLFGLDQIHRANLITSFSLTPSFSQVSRCASPRASMGRPCGTYQRALSCLPHSSTSTHTLRSFQLPSFCDAGCLTARASLQTQEPLSKYFNRGLGQGCRLFESLSSWFVRGVVCFFVGDHVIN